MSKLTDVSVEGTTLLLAPNYPYPTDMTVLFCESVSDQSFNAPHTFVIAKSSDMHNENCYTKIKFQQGPVKECGENGIYNEDLICIVLERLIRFQESNFACPENEEAIKHLKLALSALNARKTRRTASGVFQTNEIDDAEREYVKSKEGYK